MNERARRSRTLTPSQLRQSLEEQTAGPSVIVPPNLRRSRAQRFSSRLMVLFQIAVFVSVIVIPAAAVARSTPQAPAAAPEATPLDPATDSTRGTERVKQPVETPAPTETAKPKPSSSRSTPKEAPKGTKATKPSTSRGSITKTPTVATATESPTVTTAAVGEPTIVSDKADYAPGETVTLTGENWAPGEVVHILVNDTYGSTWNRSVDVTASGAGVIVDSFGLPTWFVSDYNVAATGPVSGTATTTFTDAAAAVTDFKQCANEDPNLGSCHWITSIVQDSNSSYAEGMDVPQRLIFTGVGTTTLNDHTLVFNHDATKGGVHAYDWLTSYEQAQADSLAAGIPLTLNQCGPEIGPPASLGATCAALRDGAGDFFIDVTVPNDPYISQEGSTQTRIDAYEALRGDRTIRIWGNATFTSASLQLVHDVANGGDTGNSKITYTLTWRSASTEVLIEMAGHIALANTAAGWGAGQGASSISGGPYHFSLKSLDGDASGAQDNQIKGADLIQPASITIIKNGVPDGEQDFAYTTTGTGLSPFTLDDNGSNADGTSNTQVFGGILSFGNKTVTETLPVTGYDLTNIVCSGDSNLLVGADGDFDPGDSTVTIDLDEGEDVTCTYTNTARGTITIIKNTVPDSDQDFAYTTTGSGLSGFTLDDNGNNLDGTSNTKVFDNVVPGAYTVVETLPVTGYDLTDVTCTGDDTADTDDNATAVIDLDAGESITCTYTNTARGTITIIKNTVPDSDQDFAYTTTGSGLSGFTLDDNGNNLDGTSNTKVFNNVVPGAYTVVETLPVTGYDLTDVTCTGDDTADTDDNATAVIDLDAGESITCTYTNTARGTITIIKNTVPDSDQDFAYTTTGSGLSGFTLDDNGNNLDGTSNTKVFNNVVPGAYTVVETLPVTGYDLTDVTCTGDDTADTDDNATAVIDLDAGESITCTYTNTARGTITIIKNTVPDSDQDFAYTTTGSGLSGFTLDDNGNNLDGTSNTKVFNNVVPGAYTVVETLPVTGYDLTDVTCTGDDTADTDDNATAVIDLDAGESITCTYTNTARGTITIIKNTVPDSDQDFAYTTTGSGLSGFTLDDNGNNLDGTSNTKVFNNVVPGAYTVVETLPVTGYDLTDVTCTGDDTADTDDNATAVIDLDAGESITCTYTNTARGTITIIKDVDPEPDATDFSFTTSASLAQAGDTFSLDDDGDPVVLGDLDDTIVFANLAPGATYTVGEDTETGYDLTTLSCTGLSTGDTSSAVTGLVSVSLEAGQVVECTYTNVKRGKVHLTKTFQGVEITDPNVSFEFQIREGASTLAGDVGTTLGTEFANSTNGGVVKFTTPSNQNGIIDAGESELLLVPGDYQLCEFIAPGWDSDIASLPGAFVPGSADPPTVDNAFVCAPFTLTAGETEVFTIDNTPPPGGMAKTIGFWKNHTSCDGKGNQEAFLDQALTAAGSLQIGDLTVLSTDEFACEILVDLLDKRDYKLASALKDGKKLASDPALNFASQYVAYLLNIASGAGTCSAATTAAGSGQAILAAIDFDGTTADLDPVHGAITGAQKANLNTYAGILDQYNNNTLCP